jgi:hypothetical protein
MNNDLLYLEVFGSDNNIEIREVPRVPELDFDSLDGAKDLATRQQADSDVEKVILSDLLKSVLGEEFIPEQKVRPSQAIKVPRSQHRKAIEGMVTKAFPVARTSDVRDARNALIDSMEHLLVTELKQH